MRIFYFVKKKKIHLGEMIRFFLKQKLLKLTTYISKTEYRTKNIIYVKNELQVNSNLPCKFGPFWRKLYFWGGVWAPMVPKRE